MQQRGEMKESGQTQIGVGHCGGSCTNRKAVNRIAFITIRTRGPSPAVNTRETPGRVSRKYHNPPFRGRRETDKDQTGAGDRSIAQTVWRRGGRVRRSRSSIPLARHGDSGESDPYGPPLGDELAVGVQRRPATRRVALRPVGSEGHPAPPERGSKWVAENRDPRRAAAAYRSVYRSFTRKALRGTSRNASVSRCPGGRS